MDWRIDMLDPPLHGYCSKPVLRTAITHVLIAFCRAIFCSHAEALQRLLCALALLLLAYKDRQGCMDKFRGQVPLLRWCQDEQSLQYHQRPWQRHAVIESFPGPLRGAQLRLQRCHDAGPGRVAWEVSRGGLEEQARTAAAAASTSQCACGRTGGEGGRAVDGGLAAPQTGLQELGQHGGDGLQEAPRCRPEARGEEVLREQPAACARGHGHRHEWRRLAGRRGYAGSSSLSNESVQYTQREK